METLTFEANVSDDDKVPPTLPSRCGRLARISCFIPGLKGRVWEKKEWLQCGSRVERVLGYPGRAAIDGLPIPSAR